MICCQFIFKPNLLDDEFTALDDAIEAYAQSLDGFVGTDRYRSPDGTVRNSIYYFTDMDTMREFAKFPTHLTAKREYARWYDGYQIVVSEVTASYGDGRIPHLTAPLA